jgi:hypothetical protein
MVPRVRRSAHPVVKNAVRWHLGQVEQTFVNEPLLEGSVDLGKGARNGSQASFS